jgi:hypothetical protein
MGSDDFIREHARRGSSRVTLSAFQRPSQPDPKPVPLVSQGGRGTRPRRQESPDELIRSARGGGLWRPIF